MSRYINNPLPFNNTNINNNNASTVNNLLKTISTMSQQCKDQRANDEILARIRSIIYLYRPHLKGRRELQITELVMEALVPSTPAALVSAAGGKQITHNYNYKYDYNTNYIPNMPATMTNTTSTAPATDSFGVPIGTVPNYPTTNVDYTRFYSQAQPAVQNLYINAVPSTTIGATSQTSAPSSLSPSQAPALVTFEAADENKIDVVYNQFLTTRTLETYKQLITVLVDVSKKYINTKIFIFSIEKLYYIDTLMRNDLVALVSCINSRTGFNYAFDNPELCDIFSAYIRNYYLIAGLLLERKYNEFTYTSVVKLQEEGQLVKSNLEQMLTSGVNSSRRNDMNIVTLQNEIETLRRRNETLIKDMNSIDQTEFMTVKFELQQERDKNNLLQKNINERDQMIDTHQKEISRLNGDVDALKNAILKNRNELDSKNEDISRLQIQYTNIREEANAFETKYNDLLLQTQSKNRVIEREQTTKIIELQDLNQNLESNLADLRTQLKTYETRVQRLETLNTEANANIVRLKTELNLQITELNDYKRNLTNSRAETDRLKVQLLEAEQTSQIKRDSIIESLNRELTKLRAALNAKQQSRYEKLKDNESDAAAAITDYEEMRDFINRYGAKANFDRIEKEISALKENCQRINEFGHESPKDALQLNEVSTSGLTSTIHNLKQENDDLKFELTKKINEHVEEIKRDVELRINKLKRPLETTENNVKVFKKFIIDKTIDLENQARTKAYEASKNYISERFNTNDIPMPESTNEADISSSTAIDEIDLEKNTNMLI